MEMIFCDYCGKLVPKSEAVYYENAGIYACPDCAKEKLTRCARCGEIIAYDDACNGVSGEYICDICHDDLFG